MTVKKVFVVGQDRSTASLFQMKGYGLDFSVATADLICFTGGADVGPGLYEHPRHQTTYDDARRDDYEMGIFHAAFHKGIPMVGICRGGQFLNVMNGGEMYQNVTNHTTSHYITPDHVPMCGEKIYVTSTHHQMMKPGSDGRVLAFGGESNATYWDKVTESWKESQLRAGIEVVKYGNHLCFQPHPEMHMAQKQFGGMRDYFFACIDMYCQKA